MSGENLELFDLPPGLNRTSSQYAAGKSWWNGNLVRWVNRTLTPIGGWVTKYNLPDISGIVEEAVRSTHSWRDLLKTPWAAYGSANALWASRINSNGTYTFYIITPAALGYNPGGKSGYGSGPYGVGPYGISPSGGTDLDSTAVWSFDNFGKMLVAVSSQDGRLIIWDPATPTVEAVAVGEAPVDNTLVVVTDEEFLMVMGGKNNPRRVKWASRRTYTDWVPTELNSAGGFDLQSNGVIIGACRVPGGVLVLTDTDAHLLEYVGPPYYYGRRRISTECELVSINAVFSVSFGAVWLGRSSFWMYNGAVNKLPCSVEYDVFLNSSLSQAHLVHGGINQYAQEAWWFYPSQDSSVPNRYAAYGYNKDTNNYWTSGEMPRTAWMNPVWQDKPLGFNDQTIYVQETGSTADGALRNVFAETGAIEINNGNSSYRIDRVYPDVVNRDNIAEEVTNLSMTFKLRQAPGANERTYGPISISSDTGYIPVRMRARQVSLTIKETAPSAWGLGKFRIRVKEAGRR